MKKQNLLTNKANAKAIYRHQNKTFELAFNKKTTQLLTIKEQGSEQELRLDNNLLPPELIKVRQQEGCALLPLALQNSGPVSISTLILNGMLVSPETILTAIRYGNANAAIKMLTAIDSDRKRYDYINTHFQGCTMLITAANYGQLQMCEFLLRHGANVNHCLDGSHTQPKGTAIFHAAVNGHLEICELLISHGADVTSIIKQKNKAQEEIRFSLLEALENEPNINQNILRLLRQYAAAINGHDNLNHC